MAEIIPFPAAPSRPAHRVADSYSPAFRQALAALQTLRERESAFNLQAFLPDKS